MTLRNTASTDHVSFDQVGLPGFQFIQDPRDPQTWLFHLNSKVRLCGSFDQVSPPEAAEEDEEAGIINTSEKVSRSNSMLAEPC